MTSSPYAEVGPRLVELGYSAIPIAPGSKAPGHHAHGRWTKLEGWSILCKRLPNEGQLAEWVTWPNAGVGICLGPASGLVAIDFDTGKEHWPRLEAIIPKSPVVKRGEKGYTAFYRHNGEASKSWRNPNGNGNIVELLSVGRQTIIPPTIHPKTNRPYTWDGESLLDWIADDLPALPEHLVPMFDEVLGLRKFSRETVVAVVDGDVPSPEMLADMLSCISPELGAEDWLAIGSAIKSAYPNDVGFKLWNDWSARDTRKGEYRPNTMPRRWESLNRENQVSLGTIYHHARVSGFQNWAFDEDKRLVDVSPDIIPALAIQVMDAGDEPKPQAAIPPDIVATAPGLVGRIARWVTATALKPQPVLSLGAALATVGALKGHIVRTQTNLRTNHYILGLGGSGAGKNHPLVALRYLLHHTLAAELAGNIPKSQPGLFQTLYQTRGRCVILWDEIGHAVSAMCKPDTPTHYSQIVSTFTAAFSAAGSILQGEQLGSAERESVVQPCLCIYGTTVPSRFFENLSQEEVIDGFLARWLVFEVETNWPELNESASLDADPIPEHLIEDINALESRKPQWEPGTGQLLRIDPIVVPFSSSAAKLMSEARKHFEDLAKRSEQAGDKVAPIWVRAAEHAAKIALTVADGDVIEDDELGWALDLVDAQCRNMVRQIETRISKNSQEKNTKRVLEIISVSGAKGVKKSRLCRETQWLTSNERNGILSTLIDSEQIAAVRDERDGPGQRSVTYKILG